jgi:hypothetical protein
MPSVNISDWPSAHRSTISSRDVSLPSSPATALAVQMLHSSSSDAASQKATEAAASAPPMPASPEFENAQDSAARRLSTSRAKRGSSPPSSSEAFESGGKMAKKSRTCSACQRATERHSPLSASLSIA